MNEKWSKELMRLHNKQIHIKCRDSNYESNRSYQKCQQKKEVIYADIRNYNDNLKER